LDLRGLKLTDRDPKIGIWIVYRQTLIKAGIAKNSEHMEAAVSLMEQLAASDASKADVIAK
jgi:hypothetical protein